MVVAGILLSRIAGLLRQRVSAHYFGTSLLADVLAAGFRVGNITQNLLGEGTLSASFIPVYAKLRGGLGLGGGTGRVVGHVGSVTASARQGRTIDPDRPSATSRRRSDRAVACPTGSPR
jgi:hypothetical protein